MTTIAEDIATLRRVAAARRNRAERSVLRSLARDLEVQSETIKFLECGVRTLEDALAAKVVPDGCLGWHPVLVYFETQDDVRDFHATFRHDRARVRWIMS